MGSTATNPMPQGKQFVDSSGNLTQEAYWFLLTLLNTTQNNEAALTLNLFVAQGAAVTSDPAIVSLQRAAAFTNAESPVTALALAAIQRTLAFEAQVSSLRQQVADLQKFLAFRPQPPAVTITEAQIAAAEALTGVAGTNTITGSTLTPYSVVVAGFMVRLVPANTNSGATTLNVNGIGASAVTKNGSTALVGGEFQQNREYLLLWDGTRWQIVGASFPISALVLASDASGNPSAAALADTKFWIGSGGNIPVAQSMSGDAMLADTGALTLATVNTNVGTFGDATDVAQVTVDGKGRITSAANVPITFPPTVGFTGTLAAAIAGGKNVTDGLIDV